MSFRLQLSLLFICVNQAKLTLKVKQKRQENKIFDLIH